MATSESQSKSLIFQAQYMVADQINKCPDLEATPFWPEDLLDIEYQIHDALSRQGIACTVMTPQLNYQGRCGKSTAWDLNPLQLVIVENPQINRARENATTALDVAYTATEWLCGPGSDTKDMFAPVSIKQGEEGNLVVVTVELRGLLHDTQDHPKPFVPTTINFVDGTSEDYSISGEIDCPTLVSLGLMPEGSGTTNPPTWIKYPTSVQLGSDVTGIGFATFLGCQQLSSIAIPDNVVSIGRWALYDCVSLSEVVLPSSVQNVGEQAFFGSDNLSNVLFKGKTLA